MARSRNRRGFSAVGPARRTTPPSSLGHTAGNRNRDFFAAERVPNPTVRSPLIRTVLEIPQEFPAPPRRGSRQSATVQSRATGRSSQRPVRSPFLTATAVTPQLTERAIICAKRTIRREVLFATNRTGRGSKSPRRKPSKVRC